MERLLSPTLSLWLVTAALRVSGTGTCPSPERVQRELDVLVPDQGPSDHAATLVETPAGVELTLGDTDGTGSQRVLPKDRSCEELAEIAALVLASWFSALASQSSAAEPLPPPPRVEARTEWSWEVSLGPTGSADSDGVTAGGVLQAGVAPVAGRWAVRATAFYDGPRQLTDGAGAVSWQQLGLGLGGSYAVTRLPYRVELGGDIVLSDLLLQGESYSRNASSSSLDPGLDLGARLLLLRGQWHPWIGLWGTVWFRPETPSVQGATLQITLPEVAAFLGLGLCWQSRERF